jgi:glutathione S-transferase
MYTAAKANRAALNDEQPQAPADGQEIGGRVQCQGCWGFYNKGTNLRLYGCPCQKAKLEAVFAEPQAESKSEAGYCDDLQCHNFSPCSIHQGCGGCEEASFEGYTVYYWPGFGGRAQALMAMLEDKGVKWQRIPEPCKVNYCFAVPMVRKGGFCLSQTNAVAAYLGEELGFNHPHALRHVAAKLTADIGDLWTDVYGKRCNAPNWEAVDEFCKERVADWFATLENAAAKFGSPGFILGNQITYVDFLWWNAVEVVLFCLGAARLTQLWNYAPRLKAVYEAVAARPGVAAFAKTEPVLYLGAKDDASIPVKD